MNQRTLWAIAGVIGALVIVTGIAGGFVAFQAAQIWQQQQAEIWRQKQEVVQYDFESVLTPIPAMVTLDVDLAAGAVNITFVDNATLVYRIHVNTTRWDVNQNGAPVVAFSANTIALNYVSAGATILLGSGTNYTLNTDITAGAAVVTAGAHAHLGNVAVDITTGAITFQMTNAATISLDISVNLQVTTGGITVNVTLPAGSSGSFDGSAALGGVTVNPHGIWSLVSGLHYETSDYGTAETLVTMTAETTVGGVTADLA